MTESNIGVNTPVLRQKELVKWQGKLRLSFEKRPNVGVAVLRVEALVGAVDLDAVPPVLLAEEVVGLVVRLDP